MVDENPTTKTSDRGKVLHAWKFPEFTHYQRSGRWYSYASLVAVVALVWALFERNLLFAIIVILAAIIYVMTDKRRPRLIPFTVTEDGISIDRDFYAWAEIDKFWIVYQPPLVKKLFFRFKAALRPSLTVLLEKENPVIIRQTLLDYMGEDLNGEEPGSDQISRLLKL